MDASTRFNPSKLRLALALSLIVGSLCTGALEARSATGDPRTPILSTVMVKARAALPGEPGRLAQILINQPTTMRYGIGVVSPEGLQEEPKHLNLFPDRDLIATRTRIDQRGPNNYTWFGKIDQPAAGSAILVVNNGNLTATILVGSEFYSIDPVGQGFHVVRQIDPNKYPVDDPPGGVSVQSEAAETAASSPDLDSSAAAGAESATTEPETSDVPNSDAGADAKLSTCPPKIRVLVAYTPKAAQNQFDLPSRIQMAVDETQQIYINSTLNLKIELAQAAPVSYTETGNFDLDLANFRALDSVHTLRNQSAADVVVLILDNHQYCGLAAAIKATASTAYAAVDWLCLQPGQFSFAHEIGHLQGARHNPEADFTPLPYVYGHGYRNDASGWRTVMSYDCPSGCPRIPYFANPLVLYQGVPTGKLPFSADAVVLSKTAETVAGFYFDCTSSGSDSSSASAQRGPVPRVYLAKPGEIFIALGNVLLKVAGTGGTGQSMFGGYVIGSQNFPATISDVAYIGGYTLVGLTDGRMVKVNDTGGSGQNMFAIQTDSSGFTGVSGYHYYVGSHRFDSGVVRIKGVSGETLVSFADGKVLKVAGTGGSGFNLFAIQESSSSFTGVAGYHYYIGDAKFNGRVTDVTPIASETLFSFSNGKLLKIRATGGTGHNMFAVQETSGGFNGLPGYPYYIGEALFSSPVTKVAPIGGETLIGMANGKMLKVKATGGTGHNMFAVQETSGGFNGLSGYPYYIGDTRFDAAVTDVLAISGVTLIGQADGKLLKVTGTGGTGHNMFAVTEDAGGFQTVPGYNYLLGSSGFGSAIAGLVAAPDGSVFVSLGNGKMFKARNAGGTGHNLFAVSQLPQGFVTLCCYDYWVGSL